jgi:hypothetical protein
MPLVFYLLILLDHILNLHVYYKIASLLFERYLGDQYPRRISEVTHNTPFQI